VSCNKTDEESRKDETIATVSGRFCDRQSSFDAGKGYGVCEKGKDIKGGEDAKKEMETEKTRDGVADRAFDCDLAGGVEAATVPQPSWKVRSLHACEAVVPTELDLLTLI
jgi:hypothetical protein